MKAKHVIMQLGTQATVDGTTLLIADSLIKYFIRYTLPELLKDINGGYSVHHGTSRVYNIGYRETVFVVSFILPDVSDIMDVVEKIRKAYCETFNQESVVTVITDCEALL
jgi:hypothetical protein